MNINNEHTLLILDSSQAVLPMSANEAERNAAFSLLLPGKVLHLNALSHLRKFRDHGNKFVQMAKRSFDVSALLEPSPHSSKRRRLLALRVNTPVTPKRKQITPRRRIKRTPKRFRGETSTASLFKNTPPSCLSSEGKHRPTSIT